MGTANSGERREVDGTAQPHGLVIYRASRLEALLDPLRQLLAVTVPGHPLAPQTVVAAHPGMKSWLTRELARTGGGEGIAANLDSLLPSAWIDRLAQQHLGQQAVALPRYRRVHLRWAIHRALSSHAEALGIDDARVAAFLHAAAGNGGGEAARRRFQLADRLAAIYAQYLVYRPDWLQAWERGYYRAAVRAEADAQAAATERQLLGPLWRHLRERLGAHRGDVVVDLLHWLRGRTTSNGEALHVFGVSHLAPSELAVLRAYAQRQLVALYVPDPCRQYWGGLERSLPGLRRQRLDEQARIEQSAGADYWSEQHHPLLAGWGRLGQHFAMALADDEGDVLEDVRHWRDELPTPPAHRLERVQQSIRELDLTLLDAPLAGEADIERERRDASLRVHACHTRLRELDVLRDQLLDALASRDAQGRSIQPSDIVVMAPDIRAYAPLIPAVFGAPGDAQATLPYHLADVPTARAHPVFSAFRRLLDLPAARFTAPEVMDLLAVPEIARRLDLDSDGIDRLAQWLRRTRVAWALDGAFRTRFGAPPIAEHTFGWAMDRLLAGYLMADAQDTSAVVLPDGNALAPLRGIEGPAATHLGALGQLLEQVQALCSLAAAGERPASAWAAELEYRYDALFRIDPDDAAARDAEAQLRRFLREIGSEPQVVGDDPLVHFAVVRDLLAERLDAVPARQRFLMGGITFCGMVPQRSIPFKVVAVLGLNDGEYPRAGSDGGGLDLMARYRRLGDRDVRSDDRYLFLETLMSARERLHLSYLGEGASDGQRRNPAAPLAELLAELDAHAGLSPDDTGRDRPWLVRHPLQPFDARYFDGRDPRLFSFDARFAALPAHGGNSTLHSFLDDPPAAAAAPSGPVTLEDVQSYYRDPARQLLHGRLQLRLDALDDQRLPHQEPLAPRFEAIDGVTRRLFFDEALPSCSDVYTPEEPPGWLRLGGLLPPGQPGREAWENERVAVDHLLRRARTLPGFAQGAPSVCRIPVELTLGAYRLAGTVPQVYAVDESGAPQWLLLRVPGTRKGKPKLESELGFRDRVPLFLDWAALRLHTASEPTPPRVRLHALVADNTPPWQQALAAWDERFVNTAPAQRSALRTVLEQRVQWLVQAYLDAAAHPARYFPKTAWARVRHLAQPSPRGNEEPDAPDVSSAWLGGHHGMGERDYAPGYAWLLGGALSFAPGSAEANVLAEFARALLACITLGVDSDGTVT